MPYRDKDAQREYQRLWVAARRITFFQDKCCVQCTSRIELELDHVDRASKVDHKIWSWSESRRLKEIEKCQVLCGACHREKTDQENSRPITHGQSGYDRACRCDVCKQAQSSRMKKYKRVQAQGASPAFQAA